MLCVSRLKSHILLLVLEIAWLICRFSQLLVDPTLLVVHSLHIVLDCVPVSKITLLYFQRVIVVETEPHVLCYRQ